jgi:hypothetical protein
VRNSCTKTAGKTPSGVVGIELLRDGLEDGLVDAGHEC